MPYKLKHHQCLSLAESNAGSQHLHEANERAKKLRAKGLTQRRSACEGGNDIRG